jgi:hypothetical protein
MAWISLRTHDGTHYLRAYGDGRVAADATAVGEVDERWHVLFPFGDDRCCLQAAVHERYMTAHPDGRVTCLATEINAWELFRLVKVDGGWQFLSDHERFLCAEGGGGGDVRANREHGHAWETFTPSKAGAHDRPGPRPVGDMAPLSVEDNKRWFSAGGQRFDWREISAFGRLGQVQAGRDDLAREGMRQNRALGFTLERVFVVNPIDPWKSGPDRPDFWPSLTRLLAIAAEEGMRLRLTFIAASEPWGGVWHPDRRDIWDGSVKAGGEQFAVELAVFLIGVPHVVGELANEPGQIGMRDSFDDLIALGRKVKAVNPGLLLCAGAVDGPNDQDTRFCVEPFDYVDAHIERRSAVGGFEWVKRSGEYALIDQEHVGKRMPFVSGEPINFAEGRSGDVDTSPSVAFAYGAVSRARQFNSCFHYDGGLRAEAPGALALEHVHAYMEALNAFPMLTGTKWRGHWVPQSFFRQVWPGHDDPPTVERHLREGRGPWRVFGCDGYAVAFPEPKDWPWQANVTASAERVATSQAGTFAASVYRRS